MKSPWRTRSRTSGSSSAIRATAKLSADMQAPFVPEPISDTQYPDPQTSGGYSRSGGRPDAAVGPRPARAGLAWWWPPVAGPAVDRFGSQRPIEGDGGPVPVQHRPLPPARRCARITVLGADRSPGPDARDARRGPRARSRVDLTQVEKVRNHRAMPDHLPVVGLGHQHRGRRVGPNRWRPTSSRPKATSSGASLVDRPTRRSGRRSGRGRRGGRRGWAWSDAQRPAARGWPGSQPAGASSQRS